MPESLVTPLEPLPDDSHAVSGQSAPRLSVGFVLGRDFTLTPLAGFVDALRLAADREDDSRQVHCAWAFLGPDTKPCRSSCGLYVLPTAGYDCDPTVFDYVVVVGGRMAATRQADTQLLDYLGRARRANVPLVGLCTGGFLLAAAGLMDGLRCCVHFSCQREFTQRFPRSVPVTDANFVIDGEIVTCPGSIAAIDVASYLIDRHCSPARARKAQHYLLMMPEQPRLNFPERSYANRLDGAHRITVEGVRIMEMNVHRPFPVSGIAAQLNVTSSRLTRHYGIDLGTTPAAFWRELRLQQASHLLRDTSRSVTEIAYETGFSDAAHFCKAFRKHANTTPQNFRRKSR
ncbi:MAG: helix-turn-helix domain-containing protein [Gammaproteobacteria bacterium]|nr:helix-turn-helix domain-containing protein [Gammaproteobacteria bacterium]